MCFKVWLNVTANGSDCCICENYCIIVLSLADLLNKPILRHTSQVRCVENDVLNDELIHVSD